MRPARSATRPSGCGTSITSTRTKHSPFCREEDVGIEDARRVEALLDAAHEVDLDRVLELQEVRGLGAAEAVFAGDRAAQFHCEREDVGHQLLLLRRVLADDGQV